MDVRIGGGRVATITIGDRDLMNVDGVAYETGTSITFYEPGRDADDITIFFPSRDKMKQFGQKIVDEITSAE